MKRVTFTLIVLLTGLCQLMAQGPVKWQRTYGQGEYNICQSALQLKDDGYLLLQNQSGTEGNTQLTLTCTDSMGMILWEKRPGNLGLYWGDDIKRCPDHGFIITGHIYTQVDQSYDLLMIKTDSSGNVLWEKAIGGSGWDFGQSVLVTPDSAYLAIGKTYSYGAGDADIYLVKMNDNGDTLWTRTFGGDSLDFGASGDVTADRCILVAANTRSFGHGGLDAWILKLNNDGDTLWSRFCGDTLDDQVYSLKCTPDKGYVFVGSTQNYGAVFTETWLLRYDSVNQEQWRLPQSWTIGSGEDVATSVTVNDSAQFAFTGYTTGAGLGGREIFVTVMGDYYDFRYGRSFGSTEDEEATMIFQTADSGYLITGYTAGLGPANTNAYVIKTGNDVVTNGTPTWTVGITETAVESEDQLNIYPNPASDFLQINLRPEILDGPVQLVLHDLAGRVIPCPAEHASGQAEHFVLDVRTMRPGLYLLEISSGEKRWISKVIIRK